MHDKQIRRRRAVLALLVAVSLILLTDYFGESSSSPLHSVQLGIAEVFAPVQDGASKIFSPVRDIAGWFSSTLHAKSEVNQLKQTNQNLLKALAYEQYDRHQLSVDQQLLKLDNTDHLDRYAPIGANVTSVDSLLWYDTIEINKGTGDGVRLDDPVVGQGGLVGDVSDVGSDFAVVTLITSPKFAVGAMVESGNYSTGVLSPKIGNPSALLLSYLPTNAQVSYGNEVVTSGFKDKSNALIRSNYPPGILIGTVSNENTQYTVLKDQQVEVHPAVDVQHISTVQVLTDPHAGG